MAASLTSFLPAPTQHVYDREEEERFNKKNTSQVAIAQGCTAPPYGHRRGWIPRTQQDYGEGGAYPEIHVAQYPLLMGKQKTTSNALSKTLDADGKVRYDIIAKQGHGKDKVVHSSFQDLVAKPMEDEDKLVKPDEDEIADTTEKTRAALEKLVQGKISAAMPVKAAEKKAPAQYIRYTPSQQGTAFASGAKQRIIRMVEVQKDPMSPPRFKTNKKIPRGPPSPPAPVMHSPNRKVTVKEQAEWKIPPCISNWKNAKGYTIPLDKRLAADGRGLQGVHINENFSKLASALYIADRKAREAVEMRAKVEKQLAAKQKEEREEKLRELAQRARDERAGIRTTADNDDELKEREDIRRDRQKERQRDRNLARAGADKRNRIQRERERDVSEKIALGLPNTGASRGDSESMFDQRLFNRDKGMGSGFKEDDAYDVYDQPWRKDQSIGSNIYRPGKNIDKDYSEDFDSLVKSNRFVPDKEFSGTDKNRKREGPVQFEKVDDIFGLTEFLQEAKKGEKRPADDRAGKSKHDRDRKRERRD